MYYLVLNRFTTYTLIAIPVSYIFGFFIVWVLGITYYRFIWLDHNEPDKPDVDVLNRADAKNGIWTASGKILSSRKYYYLGIILSLITFLISFNSIQSVITRNHYVVDTLLTPSIVAIYVVAISILAMGMLYWKKKE